MIAFQPVERLINHTVAHKVVTYPTNCYKRRTSTRLFKQIISCMQIEPLRRQSLAGSRSCGIKISLRPYGVGCQGSCWVTRKGEGEGGGTVGAIRAVGPSSTSPEVHREVAHPANDEVAGRTVKLEKSAKSDECTSRSCQRGLCRTLIGRDYRASSTKKHRRTWLMGRSCLPRMSGAPALSRTPQPPQAASTPGRR